MDANELSAALFNHKPVIHKRFPTPEIKYSRVSAVIYREKDGKLDISAELLDKNSRSVTIADPKNIRYAEEWE